MGEPEMGQKKSYTSNYGSRHTCWSCGKKFYDLGKEDVICPGCGANQSDAPAVAGKPAPKPAPKPKVEEPPVEDDILDVIDEDAVTEDLDTFDILGDGEEEEPAKKPATEEEES